VASNITVARLKAREGREQEAEQLFEQLVTTVSERDPGTLSYGFYRASPGEYVAVEVYESSEATMAHIANVEHLRLFDVVELTASEVYGDLSHELRDIYAPFGPLIREVVVQT
jgi:quinol monooxygenase YgiN